MIDTPMTPLKWLAVVCTFVAVFALTMNVPKGAVAGLIVFALVGGFRHYRDSKAFFYVLVGGFLAIVFGPVILILIFGSAADPAIELLRQP